MPATLIMKTRKYAPEEYSTRLNKTFLGIGPSFGGLSVPELRTGLNSILRSYKTITKKSRADSINYAKTVRSLEGVKVSSLRKDELLEHLKPYRHNIKQTKVDIGIAPFDEMEHKVLRLEKDPKLKYKVPHYQAKQYTGIGYETDTLELKKAIKRIQIRREAHGLPSLPSELLGLVPPDMGELIKEAYLCGSLRTDQLPGIEPANYLRVAQPHTVNYPIMAYPPLRPTRRLPSWEEALANWKKLPIAQ